MTARVCPVHGEYAPDGICRWCEPPKRMPTNLPPGSTPCRCGEYSWLPECSPDMREGVIAGVFHSEAQCFKLDAEPPAFRFAGEDAIAVHWILDFTPAICPEDLMAAFDAELLAQHATLRWERVARRWGAKHRPWTLLEIAVECDRFMDKLIAGYIPKEWP